MAVLQVLVFFLVHVLIQVNTMALSGPVHTRYDPCGLDVIYFDKLSSHNTAWEGVIKLGAYSNNENHVIEITFEEPVEVLNVFQNTTTRESDDSHTLIFKPFGLLPHLFRFIISVTEIDEDEDDDVPIVSKFIFDNVTLCDGAMKESQTIDALNVSKSDDEEYKHVCGRRSLDHTEIVSVRTEARAGDWPWHIALLIREANSAGARYECGGNVISRTAILTAGHCVSNNGHIIEPPDIIIIAGVNNYKDLSQIGRQQLSGESVILHPSYSDSLSTADLAIIKVNKLKYTEYVQPICLWGPVYEKSNLYNQEAVVVGFGRTEHNELPDVLRATNIIIQKDEECRRFSENIYGTLLNEFTFCAGYGPNSDSNPRNGDSGGGLVIPKMQPDHRISWFLRGVLSKCGVAPYHTMCDPKYYVVYTDIGPHYGWIYHHSGLKYTMNIV